MATCQVEIKDDFSVQLNMPCVDNLSGDKHIGRDVVIGLRPKRKVADVPLP